jgi:hypothetical protein
MRSGGGMGYLAEQGEVFTRDNWGPDWICLRFNRFCSVSSDDHKDKKPAEKKPHTGPKKRVAVEKNGERHEFPSCAAAADFLGVEAYIFSRLLKRGTPYKGWAISRA